MQEELAARELAHRAEQNEMAARLVERNLVLRREMEEQVDQRLESLLHERQGQREERAEAQAAEEARPACISHA